MRWTQRRVLSGALWRTGVAGEGPVTAGTGPPALVMKLERSGSGLTHYFLFTAWLYMGHSFVGKMCGSDTPMDLDGVRLPLLDSFKSAFMVTHQLNPRAAAGGSGVCRAARHALLSV